MSVLSLATLFGLGDDASNIEGKITVYTPTSMEWFNSVNGPIAPLTFMATTYSIPASNLQTNDVVFRGNHYPLPKPGDAGVQKTVEVTFRVDKYWRIYNQLRAWKELIYNASYNSLENLESDTFVDDVDPVTHLAPYRGKMMISTINSRNISTGEFWTFEGVYPKTLGDVSFNQASTGEIQTCTVTFEFFKMSDVHNAVANSVTSLGVARSATSQVADAVTVV